MRVVDKEVKSVLSVLACLDAGDLDSLVNCLFQSFHRLVELPDEVNMPMLFIFSF